MDYSVLCNKIGAVKDKFPTSIITHSLGDKEIFLLDINNHPKLDPTLHLHLEIKNKTQDISKKLVNLFRSDKLLLDFLCCNFYDMCYKYYPKEKEDVLEKIEGFAKDINLFKIKSIGCSKKNSKLTEDYPINWITHISKNFYWQMQTLGSKGYFSNMCDCMKKIFDLIDVDYEVTNQYCYAETETTPLAQAFFQGWQLHKFYEDYITSIFEHESNSSCIQNPVVFINPSIDYNGNLRGYIELDGCLYNSKSGPIFIECKNSSEITKNYLFKFLGEVSVLEKIYAQEFTKCLVSTGIRAPIFKDLEDFNSLNKLKIFDINSHKTNYSDLIDFAKSFK